MSETRQAILCCTAGSFPVPGSRGNRALHCSGTWFDDWEAVPYPTHVQVTLTAYRTPVAVLAVLHMRASCRGQPAHVCAQTACTADDVASWLLYNFQAVHATVGMTH